MNEIKPIVLKAKAPDNCVGVIRLTPEAEKVVRRLHRRSGLSIRQIVSEIIVQSEDLIDIEIWESPIEDEEEANYV